MEDRAVTDSVAIQRLERRVKNADSLSKELEASCRESERLAQERDSQLTQTTTSRKEKAVSFRRLTRLHFEVLHLFFACCFTQVKVFFH